jgi:RND family efflux transporter MFP subunit
LIKIDAFPNEVITGTVHKISPVVDLESRTVKIEVIIDNRNLKLKSGMFANVEILTDINKDKILIPQESVLFDDNQNYVYKLDKTLKKAIRQIVTIGRNYSGNILIKDGLKSGDFVITKGQYSVFHNFPIRVVKTAENISLNQN